MSSVSPSGWSARLLLRPGGRHRRLHPPGRTSRQASARQARRRGANAGRGRVARCRSTTRHRAGLDRPVSNSPAARRAAFRGPAGRFRHTVARAGRVCRRLGIRRCARRRPSTGRPRISVTARRTPSPPAPSTPRRTPAPNCRRAAGRRRRHGRAPSPRSPRPRVHAPRGRQPAARWCPPPEPAGRRRSRRSPERCMRRYPAGPAGCPPAREPRRRVPRRSPPHIRGVASRGADSRAFPRPARPLRSPQPPWLKASATAPPSRPKSVRPGPRASVEA